MAGGRRGALRLQEHQRPRVHRELRAGSQLVVRNDGFVTIGCLPPHHFFESRVTVPADPSTEYWQAKVSEAVGKIATEFGTSGVYMDQIASMCKTKAAAVASSPAAQRSCCPQMPRRATTRRAARPAAALPGRMAIARHWPRRWRRRAPGKSSSQSRTPRPTSGACTPSSRSSERRCCFSRAIALASR